MRDPIQHSRGLSARCLAAFSCTHCTRAHRSHAMLYALRTPYPALTFLDSCGQDLLLLKLSSPAPKEWRVVELPLGRAPLLHAAAVDRAAAVRRGAVRRPAPLQGGAGGGEAAGLSLLPGRARLPVPGNLRLRPAGVRRNLSLPKAVNGASSHPSASLPCIVHTRRQWLLLPQAEDGASSHNPGPEIA